MQKFIFMMMVLLMVPMAYGASSLQFTNDLAFPVQYLRINDEGYEVKSNDLLSQNPGTIEPGGQRNLNIIHMPDDDMPTVREEPDQITQIRFDAKIKDKWHQYTCKLAKPFSPLSGKDLMIKASTCKKVSS